MKNKIKISLSGKSAIVYTLSTILSRGLAILTVPIFTRMMSTADIGTVNLFNSWYSLISVITTLSLTSGGFSVAMKEYPNDRNRYISSILSLTTIISLVIAIIYLVNISFWNRVTGLDANLMILIFIGCMFSPARDFWLAKERYEYRYKVAGWVTVLSAVAASVLSICVVLWMNKNNKFNIAEGRLFANYTIIFGVALFFWVLLFCKGKTFVNKKYWGMSLALSLPLVGYNIAVQILNVSDRIMIKSFVGLDAVGIYGTLYTVSSISVMIWSAMNASFIPYLFQNIEKENNRISEISFKMIEAFAFLAVILSLFAPEIVKILATDEYLGAIKIMPPIAAGVFFTSVAHMYSNILVYYKKTKYVMTASIIAAITNVLLNLVFIPIYGYIAASYTTLIAYILLAFFEKYWAKKVCNEYGVSKIYDDKKIRYLSLITMILTLSCIVLYKVNVWRYLMVLLIVLLMWYVFFKDR